jgi:hypothetical protein
MVKLLCNALIILAISAALPAHSQTNPMDTLRRGLQDNQAPSTTQPPSGKQSEGTTATENQPTPQTQQIQTNRSTAAISDFDPSPYARGQRLLNVYDGDFDAIAKEDQYFVTIYFVRLNKYFSSSYDFHSANCSAYFDPDLAPGVMRGVMGSMFDSSGNVSNQGLNALANIFQQLSRGPAGLMNRMTFIEGEQNAAQKDGVRLAQLPGGCENPQFARLYKNMVNYVRGVEPEFMSLAVEKRKRLERFTLAANKSCESQYKDSRFCGCMVDRLNSIEIADAGMDKISADFTNVRFLTGHSNELREFVRSCAATP